MSYIYFNYVVAIKKQGQTVQSYFSCDSYDRAVMEYNECSYTAKALFTRQEWNEKRQRPLLSQNFKASRF